MYSTLELLILPFRDLSFYLKRFFPHQVNSNVVYHSTDQYGQSKIVRVDTTYVGKKIYTKAVGLNMFEDITLTYKNQEGEFKQCYTPATKNIANVQDTYRCKDDLY